MNPEDVYRLVPDVGCKGLCQDACSVIGYSAIEADALRDNGINPPRTGADGRCSHLVAGRCAIYEHRPLVCRLFGAVRDLACPHGCKPAGGFLPNHEGHELVRRLDDGRAPVFSIDGQPTLGPPQDAADD
jgi:Fe-S-cluster containining protein